MKSQQNKVIVEIIFFLFYLSRFVHLKKKIQSLFVIKPINVLLCPSFRPMHFHPYNSVVKILDVVFCWKLESELEKYAHSRKSMEVAITFMQ